MFRGVGLGTHGFGRLGASRLVDSQGERRLLLAPGCHLLTDATRSRDEGDQAHLLLPRHQPKVRWLDALELATMPLKPPRPKARRSAMACGTSTRSRVLLSRSPIRQGNPPSPLTPRLNNPCLRSPRPSVFCPEAGRGAGLASLPSAYAP
jgi:hypothetical protein